MDSIKALLLAKRSRKNVNSEDPDQPVILYSFISPEKVTIKAIISL